MKEILGFIKWCGQIICEPDGKPSYSRVVGLYVVYKIVRMADKGTVIPEPMMTMFWVLIGYQFMSKALNSMSPAVLDFARAALLKVSPQAAVTPPAADVGAATPAPA